MKYYVDQLLDYLDLYQSLIRQGLFKAEYEKYVGKLNQEIDTLRDISHATEEELLKYDYKLLKRDLARLFHSDHFNAETKLLENPDDLLGKTFSVLDDIEKYKKRDASRAYTTGSTYYEEPHQYQQYEDTPKYGEERKRRRRQHSDTQSEYEDSQFSDSYEQNSDEVQYEYYNYDSDTFYTYKIWLTEKFNYLFRGIPYSSEEYDNLFFKYQKKCEKCLEEIKMLNIVIKQLENELNLLNIEKHNAVSKEKIDALYQSKLERLYKKACKASSEMHYYQSQLEYRRSMLRPKVEESFTYWLKDKKAYEDKYNRLLDFYQYQRANFVAMDYQKLEKEITETYNFITENYMDPVKAYQEIEMRILEVDEQYQAIKEKYDDASELLDEADLNYKNYLANPEVHKRHIKEPLEKEYEKRQRKLRNIIGDKKRRKERLETTLKVTQQKLENLQNTYGNEFGHNHGPRK